MIRSFSSLLAVSLLVAGCGSESDPEPPKDVPPVEDPADKITSGPLFATAFVEDAESLGYTASHGDLWPTCWADDDALYTANGDGRAFGLTATVDLAVSRVTGSPFDTPSTLNGETLAFREQVAQVWTQPAGARTFNRKPTGIICVDGAIYLAVQDLSDTHMEAPAASISVSKDHGKTWTWDTTKPMFDGGVMTTLMFLDFGKNNANAIDGFVYVYGLDKNWRFSTDVESPTQLWLARVPKEKIQDRSAWTYFAGMDGATPRFESDIAKRVPVLEDKNLVYTNPIKSDLFGSKVPPISQGGVVYNKALGRYLYTSWTEYTFEFYEAPQPWGPWTKFLSRDFGAYDDPSGTRSWTSASHGGYGTSIPSKFISPDGKTMFVQSNTFASKKNNVGVERYGISLRKLVVEPFAPSAAANALDAAKNLALEAGTAPIARAARRNTLLVMSDGATEGADTDSLTGETKTEDFWGYTWPRAYRINTIVFTSGAIRAEGGSFADLRAQVRKNGTWTDVAFAPAPLTGAYQTFTFSFAPVAADGARIIGRPGGSHAFTSISELAVFYR